MNNVPHRTFIFAGIGTVVAACLLVAVLGSDNAGSSAAEMYNGSASDATSTTVTTNLVPTESSTTIATPIDSTNLPDLAGTDPTADEPCTLRARSLGGGDSGDDVICLQRSLIEAGYMSGLPSGVYDNATAVAVEKLQTERNLFVDGLTGRETALSLGIWPDEMSLVVRTPPPAPGAVDLLGYPLSSVATSGPDAPPLPPNSGTGRRLVFERAGQRVWAIDENNVVIRSWLVSGSKYNNETPGTHKVYSRSDVSTAWNGKAYLYKMVRWLKTDIGAIGFHALPIHVEDNSPYQTEAELGQRLSGGCQRQANLDADFTWDFAQVGTPVVVI
jgi:peptidoglycan hydrolase-like protein with peptidoglycan-binding domain